MVELQVISKIVNNTDPALLENYGLDAEFFPLYGEQYEFIKQHYQQYGKIPDKLTFLDRFREFELIDVQETDRYLVDTLSEERLYHKSVEMVNSVAKLLQTDSNMAVEFIRANLPSLEAGTTKSAAVNIISQFDSRYNAVQEKVTAEKPFAITTGFPELDKVVNGWSLGEELVVIFARTGQGKSWVLAKTLTHAWELGYRVGFISPEMSAEKIGYRFDTLHNHFSNQALSWGKNVSLEEYKQYGEQLKQKDNPFFVATINDFQKKLTVTKLRQFCKDNKLDIIGIDGITYLTDERYRRGDNKTTTLTNLSEDLMALSLELQIPILVVVQSNRGGVKTGEEDGTPELENIRDSDGIAQNATKVISLRQKETTIEFGVKKNRDGKTGETIVYSWDIDTGDFSFDGEMPTRRREAPIPRVERKNSEPVDAF